MYTLDIVLNWIHVICVTIFIGGMFIATVVLIPVVKAHLEYEHRHKLIVNFVPRARRLMRIVVPTLILTGIGRALVLHYTHDGPPTNERLIFFGLKLLFAAVPVTIFVLAPKILGKRSEEGLCCDPDAEGPEFNACGVMTTLGGLLHFIAISGGWLAILMAIVLSRM